MLLENCATCRHPLRAIPLVYQFQHVHGHFCSRTCRDTAEVVMQHGKKGENGMVIKATEFGGVKVNRHLCDQCGEPIILSWVHLGKEFCSKKCALDHKAGVAPQGNLIEDEGDETMTDDTTTTTAAPAAAKTKKTVAKAAPKASAKPTTKVAPKPANKLKKAVAKVAAKPAKSAKKAASANGDGEFFRPGTMKALIYARLKDGKPHKRRELNEMCDKADKSRQLVQGVITRLRNEPTVKLSMTDAGIQVTEKK